MSDPEATSNNTSAAVNSEDDPGVPKTAKQLEKEAKKAAKLQKLQQKIEKKSTAPAPNKEKVEVRNFFKNI